MAQLPFDFEVWNALVNLLKEQGVRNAADAVRCCDDRVGAYRVRATGPAKRILAQVLSEVLHRRFDASDPIWTLPVRDAIDVVRTDVL